MQEAKYFNELNNTTWTVDRNYCYPYEYWISYNIDLCKTYTTTILKVVEVNQNNK